MISHYRALLNIISENYVFFVFFVLRLLTVKQAAGIYFINPYYLSLNYLYKTLQVCRSPVDH